ncbi:hypothetical protein WA026_004802 [Henosepilachna vigintioctopunctata]|uniref:Uncharacterized protein n=1 Tax=Henosepilachna vigintioctopunctata TaxID=420089 RepID=A0AAW1UV48_9CUCU
MITKRRRPEQNFNNSLGEEVEVRLCKTIIRPKVLNGCKTSVIAKKKELKVTIKVLERQILKVSLGHIKTEVGQWKRRYNKEIQESLWPYQLVMVQSVR